jgi:hypothetical protein
MATPLSSHGADSELSFHEGKKRKGFYLGTKTPGLKIGQQFRFTHGSMHQLWYEYQSVRWD